MKKLFALTIAAIGIFSSPAIAQTTSGYIYPRQTHDINPDFRGGTYEWNISNPGIYPVRVRANISQPYSINGRQYNGGQQSHIILPPRSYTPVNIDLGTQGSNDRGYDTPFDQYVPVQVEIYPY